MAASQLLARLPFLSLDAGCTVTFEAIDPATGAAVAGVTISQATIYATGSTPTATFDPAAPILAFEQLV